MATLNDLLADYKLFTDQAFRHLEKSGRLTPEQEFQAAQMKAQLALAASNMALALRTNDQ